MRRAAASAVAASLMTFCVSEADAAYSAPLIQVRVDQDRIDQAPSLLYASDNFKDDAFGRTAKITGAQYMVQVDRRSGWGVQAALSLGWAEVSLNPSAGEPVDGTGPFVGGQLRAYAQLYNAVLFPRLGARSSWVTGFMNLRAIAYDVHQGGSDANGAIDRAGREAQLGGGIGAMAEIAFGSVVSVCPYAWFSPSLFRFQRYSDHGVTELEFRQGFEATQPVRVGIDVWIYRHGIESDDHVSLSAIASLIDTTGRGNQELSTVLSYVF
jgi:hypothetical protein